MASNTSDMTGYTVYLRVSNLEEPLQRETEFSSLVGDGNLLSQPNDVVVGRGSKWVHETLARHKYSVFGRRYTSSRFGRTRNARCVLMLPVDWWEEHEVELRGLKTADIGYPIEQHGEIIYWCAGRFRPTRQPAFPALKNTKRDGSGPLLVDRTKDMRFEFVCIGHELQRHHFSRDRVA